MDNVGDQSEYVQHMSKVIIEKMGRFNMTLSSAKYYKVFADKFVEGLVGMFGAAVSIEGCL